MVVAQIGSLRWRHHQRSILFQPPERSFLTPFHSRQHTFAHFYSIVAEQYSTTPEGQAEVERAKREGSKFYGAAKENILRPGVAGGLLGVCELELSIFSTSPRVLLSRGDTREDITADLFTLRS